MLSVFGHSIKGFSRSHDGYARNSLQHQHVPLVSRDNQIGIPGNGRTQDGVILRVWRKTDNWKIIQHNMCNFNASGQLLHFLMRNARSKMFTTCHIK